MVCYLDAMLLRNASLKNGKMAPAVIAGRTARAALSSEICAGCPRHFGLLSSVRSNF